MPSPAEYETETSGNSPTASSACALAAQVHAQTSRELLSNSGKLVRQNSVREEENLTPEIVIIKNGTLSRSCTEETERIGDSVQEIYSPCSNNIEETKLDIEEDLLSPHNSVTKSCEDQDGLSSHGRLSHDSILTSGEAAHLESVSKYEFEVFEAETPGRGVSSVFICLYSVLGATILTMIILTVVFNFGMLLLLVMTVIVFIIIVILTNLCTMFYQL